VSVLKPEAINQITSQSIELGSQYPMNPLFFRAQVVLATNIAETSLTIDGIK
jgi:hypothetical protein